MKIRSCRFQNPLDVVERAFGLLANVACQHLVGFRVKRDLAGQIKQAIGLHSLRIWANGLGAAIRRDDVFHGVVSFGITAFELLAAAAAAFSYRVRNSFGTPGCFIHWRTNSATFWCTSSSKAAMRSARSTPPPRRAYSM